jgi:hypothetical protein
VGQGRRGTPAGRGSPAGGLIEIPISFLVAMEFLRLTRRPRLFPRGLQGTMLMLSASINVIVTRFGDVLGTRPYGFYCGFTACVIATTIVYALILPALLLVPKRLIDTADGQRPI